MRSAKGPSFDSIAVSSGGWTWDSCAIHWKWLFAHGANGCDHQTLSDRACRRAHLGDKRGVRGAAEEVTGRDACGLQGR